MEKTEIIAAVVAVIAALPISPIIVGALVLLGIKKNKTRM